MGSVSYSGERRQSDGLCLSTIMQSDDCRQAASAARMSEQDDGILYDASKLARGIVSSADAVAAISMLRSRPKALCFVYGLRFSEYGRLCDKPRASTRASHKGLYTKNGRECPFATCGTSQASKRSIFGPMLSQFIVGGEFNWEKVGLRTCWGSWRHHHLIKPVPYRPKLHVSSC